MSGVPLPTAEELFAQITREDFCRAVLSGCRDCSVRRIVVCARTMHGARRIQTERAMADGRVYHENLEPQAAAEQLFSLFISQFRQANFFFAAEAFSIRRSKKGMLTVLRDLSITAREQPQPQGHDRMKNRLMTEDALVFLQALSLCGADGRIYDRARPKYRQICRFLEILDDVYDELPAQGVLCVHDLCCGKSYLSFAVYAYLTQYRKRSVQMYCVDRKPDVIAFCAQIAHQCGFTGMEFLCADISSVALPAPDLVVSLHACDMATDLVLSHAAACRASVILATPCCQHELYGKVHVSAFSFWEEQPLLWHKFTDTVTDALRCKWLAAQGYRVQTVELVDPAQTPKNTLLRAVRRSVDNDALRASYAAEYRAACAMLGYAPQYLQMEKTEGEKEA
ncbi:MAG: SAM-dependent methyltransferase [Eubacteriales bacterium]|nr:SAM-dependent methyltransferase [Eubacteriales bacterium]